MLYDWLATLVVIVHFAFVLFVVLGGLMVLRVPWVAWLHLPAAVYGAAIEFARFVCPLTPLEVWLRRQAGQAGYTGGFIERYITAALYPEGLTREVQVLLGILVLVLNGAVYSVVYRRRRRRKAADA